jgi:hypothetical protein
MSRKQREKGRGRVWGPATYFKSTPPVTYFLLPGSTFYFSSPLNNAIKLSIHQWIRTLMIQLPFNDWLH